MSIRTPALSDLAALREWFDRMVFLPVDVEPSAHPYHLDRPADPGYCLDDWTFRYGLYEPSGGSRRRFRPAFVAATAATVVALLVSLPV